MLLGHETYISYKQGYFLPYRPSRGSDNASVTRAKRTEQVWRRNLIGLSRPLYHRENTPRAVCSAGGGAREIPDRLRASKKIQNARRSSFLLHTTQSLPLSSSSRLTSVKMADVKKSKTPKEFASACSLSIATATAVLRVVVAS